METPTVENENEKSYQDMKKDVENEIKKSSIKKEVEKVELDASQKLQKIRDSLEKEKLRLQKEKQEMQKIIDIKYLKNENEIITWFNKWINDKDSKFDHASWALDHLNYSPNFFDNLSFKLEEKGFKCCFEFKTNKTITRETDCFILNPYFTVALPTYNPKYVSTYEDMKILLSRENEGLFKYITLKSDGFKKDFFYTSYYITN